MKSEIMITPDIIRVIIFRTRDSSLRIELGLIIGLGFIVDDELEEVGGSSGKSEESDRND